MNNLGWTNCRDVQSSTSQAADTALLVTCTDDSVCPLPGVLEELSSTGSSVKQRLRSCDDRDSLLSALRKSPKDGAAHPT